jgi:hypothetical protein
MGWGGWDELGRLEVVDGGVEVGASEVCMWRWRGKWMD